jgi:RNA polymerase sigma-70 factor (ECF subfamily)
LQEPTDAELLRRARSGDEPAFARIVDRHKGPLVNYLARLSGSREDAEEHAQEAFFRLYRASGRFRPDGKIAPLLFRIAINLARTRARRDRLWRLFVEGRPGGEAQEAEPADGAAMSSERQRLVRDAIGRLPPRCREVILLRDIEGWSYAEIASAVGCGEGTLKSRIGRGREMLRRDLEPYWESAPRRREGSGRG